METVAGEETVETPDPVEAVGVAVGGAPQAAPARRVPTVRVEAGAKAAPTTGIQLNPGAGAGAAPAAR